MTDKDTRKILREAERQGFTLTINRKGYTEIRDPHGDYVTKAAQTPSDRRGILNLLAALRRAGFTWPPPGKGRK